MTSPVATVLADEDAIASAVADALVTRLSAPGVHHLVLTGGGVGTRVLAELRHRAAGIDWRRVHLWWGDERFLPEGDADRNETGARQALIDYIDIPSDHVHAMPADVGQGAEAAAAAYADELARASDDGIAPRFGVLLLGMGPEGHVASIFPDSLAVHAGSPVVAVHDCPKPPPTRVTLTLPLLRSAEEVWVVATGPSKADAVAQAMDPATSVIDVPAAGARGRARTVFWMDRASAAARDAGG